MIVLLLTAVETEGFAYGWQDAAFAYFLAPQLVVYTIVPLGAITLLVSIGKIIALRTDGAVVAKTLGGSEISNPPHHEHERRLLNAIHDMALASGMPMPRIFIINHEKGVNAFASGVTPQNAAITVTKGLLDSLPDNELRAVVGHEFSHIANGDMTMNTWLIGGLFGIEATTFISIIIIKIGLGIACFAGAIFSWKGMQTKDDNTTFELARLVIAFFIGIGGCCVILIGGVVWLLGKIGQFWGNVLRCGISRQREFLADATTVQYTRKGNANYRGRKHWNNCGHAIFCKLVLSRHE